MSCQHCTSTIDNLLNIPIGQYLFVRHLIPSIHSQLKSNAACLSTNTRDGMPSLHEGVSHRILRKLKDTTKIIALLAGDWQFQLLPWPVSHDSHFSY